MHSAFVDSPHSIIRIREVQNAADPISFILTAGDNSLKFRHAVTVPFRKRWEKHSFIVIGEYYRYGSVNCAFEHPVNSRYRVTLRWIR